MAYGLRGITNAGYNPYGSGRDYFFIGDFQYINGRRTPDCNTRWREEKKGMKTPKRQSKGQPQEMAATKSINSLKDALKADTLRSTGNMSPRIAERLRRQQSEPTCNDALIAGSLFANHANRWKDANASKREAKPVSCLRLMGPKDTSVTPYGTGPSTYMDLGQVEKIGLNYTFSNFGAPEKYAYHSTRGGRAPTQGRDIIPSKEEIDEHMREFPGSQKFPVTQQTKFYQNALNEREHPLDMPLTKTTDGPTAHLSQWGCPAKHHNHSCKKLHPPDSHEDYLVKAERPPRWKPADWGHPDKHRYHQPPLWAPKEEDGKASHDPARLQQEGATRENHIPGKDCEIPQVGGFPLNVTRRQAKPKDHGIY